MGVVMRRWVWLENIGVVSGCFPHITYISLLLLYLLFFAAASLLLFSFCYYNYAWGVLCKYASNNNHLRINFFCNNILLILL